VAEDPNAPIIDEFRANAGVVTGPFQDVPLVLVTMKGAKTGRTIVKPLAYGLDGDEAYVVASKAGAPKHPTWYFNLRANPQVTVERGTETYQATAVEAPEPERTRLYDMMAERIPGFAGYQQKTDRVIPIFRLVRT
jgi:deazaflavin-dependent oxidoreductase (nitroreductase family)